ncbi:hypothetical protein AVDCRST_MAG84-5558 [uncultured Microcoleus sp.]|uniref:Uncharacterized protein n=1 Tax=uncultured Microcoleus sp. TaxID=259945 RepID=A0A6J4NQZ9_9CYAN|nr:hypothetical protein AVDCRST_MAG84-5558 [uncultured Microcoleus sp.]
MVESDRDLNFRSISHFHPSVDSNLKSQISNRRAWHPK